MRVLVVDDSVVFRSQIKSALASISGVDVVGVANNGRIALQKLAQSSVDLITLDMEMPEMGGIETIQEIRKAKFPVKIIIFSSHTPRGSEAALEALAKGADDFVAKPIGDDSGFEKVAERIRGELLPKIMQFMTGETSITRSPATIASTPSLLGIPSSGKAVFPTRELEAFHPSVIVIGSSTGGPQALEKLLCELSLPFRLPILIAQHMPQLFTASLAKRLETTSGIPCAEAKQGELILGNRIYVAPGDFHMLVEKSPVGPRVKLDQRPPRNSVRPAVDYLFESAAAEYANRTMGIVLTGMGEDGLQGCKAIKEKGGGVMIQSRESCVVFGMPGAVFSAGWFDKMGSIPEIQALIRKMGI